MSEFARKLSVKTYLKPIAFVVALAVAFGAGVLIDVRVDAGGTTPAASAPSADKYVKAGFAALKLGNFNAAVEQFAKADKLKRRDPDILNMLAYSLRKAGDLDKSIATYRAALKLRDKFPQAREYLGRAYIENAMHQLETIIGYGENGKPNAAVLVDAMAHAAERAQAKAETAGITASDRPALGASW